MAKVFTFCTIGKSKDTLVQVKVLIQFVYSSKSEKVLKMFLFLPPMKQNIFVDKVVTE